MMTDPPVNFNIAMENHHQLSMAISIATLIKLPEGMPWLILYTLDVQCEVGEQLSITSSLSLYVP